MNPDQPTQNTAPAFTLPDSPNPSSSTPKRATHSGVAYVRTKNGNLVSLDFLKQRKANLDKKQLEQKKDRLDRLVGVVTDVQAARDEAGRGRGRGRGRERGTRGRGRGGAAAGTAARLAKSKRLCKFFQKTGSCSNGLTCPYIHDSTKVAICPLSLRNTCPHSPSTCSLSHVPSPHRSPHCTHFPHCRLGIDCPYTHVVVPRDAPVCRDFVEYGWCDRGELCTDRHAFECPDFAESGTCGRKGCKLPHVLRRRNGGQEEERVNEAGEGERVREQAVGGKREREEGEDEREGISGARGRALKKAREEADVKDGADFIMFASEDDYEAEDAEGEDDEEEDEEEGEDVVEVEDDLESVSSFDDEVADRAPSDSQGGEVSSVAQSATGLDDDSDDEDEDGAVASLLVR